MAYRVTADMGGIVLNETDKVKSVLQNVSIILQTIQQSVPLYREFGMPMQFQDAPANTAIPTLMVEVSEAIQTYEPRASLLSVNFIHDSNGILMPEVEVEVIE